MELLSKKEAELKNLANFHPIHIKEKKKKENTKCAAKRPLEKEINMDQSAQLKPATILQDSGRRIRKVIQRSPEMSLPLRAQRAQVSGDWLPAPVSKDGAGQERHGMGKATTDSCRADSTPTTPWGWHCRHRGSRRKSVERKSIILKPQSLTWSSLVRFGHNWDPLPTTSFLFLLL